MTARFLSLYKTKMPHDFIYSLQRTNIFVSKTSLLISPLLPRRKLYISIRFLKLSDLHLNFAPFAQNPFRPLRDSGVIKTVTLFEKKKKTTKQQQKTGTRISLAVPRPNELAAPQGKISLVPLNSPLLRVLNICLHREDVHTTPSFGDERSNILCAFRRVRKADESVQIIIC